MKKPSRFVCVAVIAAAFAMPVIAQTTGTGTTAGTGTTQTQDDGMDWGWIGLLGLAGLLGLKRKDNDRR